MKSKLNLKQVLGTYQATEQEELTDSSSHSSNLELQASENSSEQSLSPLQQMMQMIFAKANINLKMLQFLGKAFPGLGESLNTLNDPNELHIAVHDIVAMFQKGLELDHAGGYGEQDICFSPDPAETGQESAKSLLSGSDGYRQIDTDGGASSGIPGSVLGTEATSEVPVLRYETEVQGGEGA